MTLDKIELENFRLHENSSITFSKELNFIVGSNGQGKTSILEAIFFICTTKSFNQINDYEVVNFNKNHFSVSASLIDLINDRIRIFYDKSVNKKFITVNEKQIYKASELVGKFPVVTLIQSDHNITQGAPAERRKFFDNVISQSSSLYLKNLLDYHKSLKNKTALLNKIREAGKNIYDDQLNAWNSSLAKYGAELLKKRKEFLSEYKIYLKESYNKILAEDEIPDIEYSSPYNGQTKEIENKFFEDLTKAKADEIRRVSNLIGPHRDEYLFKINNLELRRFGSQGQHKTFQIALKFAHFNYINEKSGKKPIFLLDDVFGELDTFRTEKISELLSEVGQAFITMTDMTNLDKIIKSKDTQVIRVNSGRISYGIQN